MTKWLFAEASTRYETDKKPRQGKSAEGDINQSEKAVPSFFSLPLDGGGLG
jgi:hypothetical protein